MSIVDPCNWLDFVLNGIGKIRFNDPSANFLNHQILKQAPIPRRRSLLYYFTSPRQITTDIKVLNLTVVSSIITTMIYKARYYYEIGRRRFYSFFISIAAADKIHYSGFIKRLYEYYYIDGVGRNSDSAFGKLY